MKKNICVSDEDFLKFLDDNEELLNDCAEKNTFRDSNGLAYLSDEGDE